MDLDFVNACLGGDLDEIVRLTDLNPKLAHDVFGFEAVIIKGHLDAVKHFIKKGARLAPVNTHSLIWAAHNKHINVLNYLRKIAGDDWKCHKCIVRSTCLDLCEGFRNGH